MHKDLENNLQHVVGRSQDYMLGGNWNWRTFNQEDAQAYRIALVLSIPKLEIKEGCVKSETVNLLDIDTGEVWYLDEDT